MSALTMSLVAGAVQAADAAKSGKGKLVSGIETEYIDPTVRAQDDFFTHLNGKWLKTVEIPADRSSWGSFQKLIDDTQPKLLAIIENAAKDPNKKPGSDTQKIGDFYASFMDEARLDQLGMAPLASEMANIAALKDKGQLPALMAHASKRGISSPVDFYIHQDAKDSTKYVADLVQSGLGMPDRDYYLKDDDAKLKDVRAKYVAHIEKMLTLAGDANAAAKAKAIVELETALAQAQWTKVENRDPVKTYNKVDIAKMDALAPGFDWNSYLAASGIAGKTNYVIVSQPSYLKQMAEIVNRFPLETWQAYYQFQTIRAYAGYMGKAIADANFEFNGTVLSGAKEQRPRWKRGVSAVEGALGEMLGKQYVEHNFPAGHKARMEVLVKNLLVAFKQSINTLDWMSPATKKQAQAKLAKFTPKIGYPNKWKDYSGLTVARDDLVGNVMRSRELEHGREVSKLGRPIDRDEWGMTPQTINAYYNPELNEIVFPAAILQPPFFDANADDAVNYGAIGAVIGHEISHGFDDQGAQYDGDGNLRDWWTKADQAAFKSLADRVVKQYSAYSPLPNYKVNGELTLGENIADISGVAVAHKAYKLSLKGKKAPVIDGLTGDQRFFMGFGQVWRGKYREQEQINRIKTDPHAPGMYRANGTVVNQPAFYQAFGVKPGDKMYVDPKDRIIIW
jgi:predicted metalloendopeptidase